MCIFITNALNLIHQNIHLYSLVEMASGTRILYSMSRRLQYTSVFKLRTNIASIVCRGTENASSFIVRNISTKNDYYHRKVDEKFTEYAFLDKVQIEVHAGKGGNGCVSFDVLSPSKRRPSGGNGGKGGSVYLVADPELHGFSFQTYQFKATSGDNGGSAGLTGRRGKDIFVKVPVGTIVTEGISEDEYHYRQLEGITHDQDDDDDDDYNNDDDDVDIDVDELEDLDIDCDDTMMKEDDSDGYDNEEISMEDEMHETKVVSMDNPGEILLVAEGISLHRTTYTLKLCYSKLTNDNIMC